MTEIVPDDSNVAGMLSAEALGIGTSALPPHHFTIADEDLDVILGSVLLEPEQRTQLIEGLNAALSAYFGRSVANTIFAGRAESIALCRKIAHRLGEVKSALDRVHPDFWIAMGTLRKDNGRADTDRPPLPLFELEQEMRSLQKAADTLASLVPQQRAGRPNGQGELDKAVRRIHDLVVAAGLEVRLSKTRGSVRDPHLNGEGGELIVRLFARLAEYAGPKELHAALARALKN